MYTSDMRSQTYAGLQLTISWTEQPLRLNHPIGQAFLLIRMLHFVESLTVDSLNKVYAYFEIIDQAGSCRRVNASGGRLLVGRSSESDITLNTPKVSRRHAELRRDASNQWSVRDLNSRNGTKVNNRRVSRVAIAVGDIVSIGPFELRLQLSLPGVSNDEEPLGGVELTNVNPSRIDRVDIPTDSQIQISHAMILDEFGRGLMNTPGDQACLKMLADLVVSRDFHGIAAVALRVGMNREPNDTPIRTLCTPSFRSQVDHEMPYISRGLVHEVVRTGTSALASNVTSQPNALELTLMPEQMVMTAVACPLRHDGEWFDLLYVTLPPDFSAGAWFMLMALAAKHFEHANHLRMVQEQAREQAAMNRELEQARAIQMQTVPSPFRTNELDVAFSFRPCHWVGGDYVDGVGNWDGKSKTVLLVADVCGHGMASALVASSVFTMVHTCLDFDLELDELMERLNNYLCDHLPDGKFVTMACAVVDGVTGKIEYVNAGHPPMMIVGTDGKVRQLSFGENLMLGVVPAEMKTLEAWLQPGESLFMYSDGLQELVGGPEDEMLGLDGIESMLGDMHKSHGDQSVQEQVTVMEQHFDTYLDSRMPDDDRTFLIARRLPT